MNKIVFILILFLLLISCSNKKEEFKQFNKRISALIILEEKDKALKLLDSAISVNKNEISFYSQKLSILQTNCDYKGALMVFNEMENQNFELFTEQLVFKGIVYQKNNLTKESVDIYQKCLEKYFRKIEENSKDSQVIINYQFVNILLGKTYNETFKELSLLNVEKKDLESCKIIDTNAVKKMFGECD